MARDHELPASFPTGTGVTTSGPTAADPQRTRRGVRHKARDIDISFATFLRALAVVAIAWSWWRLWQWVLVFVLAVFMAVALDPTVQWLEAHRLRRRYGAPLVVLLIVLLLAGFMGLSWASLARDASALGIRLNELRDTVMSRVPAAMLQAASSLAPSAAWLTSAARGLVGGLASIGVALVVTVYFLLDGRRTFRWLVAFVPARSRGRALETAECARKVIAAYIRGNIITSLLAAVFTWIALATMQVPGALLLALLAGILDFVPVVGFFVSAAPALLLGLTVSPTVALGVTLFYVAYNMIENYYIQPKVYGRELQLSALAVIMAFLVGGTLGGVLGALIALPVAAAYPAVERIWFDRPGTTDPADEHRRIQAQPERH
jgi:predicted PurR-regulated permease PerM